MRPLRRLIALALLLLAVTPLIAQPITFRDATEAAGMGLADGYGASVSDFDGDGWDDVFVSTVRGPSRLMRNNGDGTFTDVAEAAGVDASGMHFVALWGDFDGDGWTDLFLGQRRDARNHLFRNRGDGTFEDITDATGIDPNASLGAAALGDFDGDGRLDLFLAVDRGYDYLYRNISDADGMRFEDLSGRAGVKGGPSSVAMQATWIDYDHDGDLDLFCVHDGTDESRLYRNEGFLPLREVAREAGIADVGAGNSMGVAWGDFDGDGWEDAYVTRIRRGGLYRNNRDGTFTEIAAERGVDRNGMAWGVVFADLDNDADDDLFLVNSTGYDGTPTLLYQNDGGHFAEVGAPAGAAFDLNAAGAVSADFDRDGRADLFIAATGTSKLLLNTTETSGRWVRLHLRGGLGNPSAIGARVELVVGDRTLTRRVSGGDSFCSQSSPTLHVGLGEAVRIDTVRIHWGPGRTDTHTALATEGDFVFTESATSTAVEGESVPEGFSLAQNYPNPFNPATTIRFALPRAARATLTVFDVLGRVVATPFEGPLGAGQHAVRFDAHALPGGVYLYRLSAGAFTQTRSLVLLP